MLALGMGSARLIELTADLPPQEVAVPDMPSDAAASLGRRSHLAKRGDMRGGESGSENALLSRYARDVDQALRPPLAGDDRPLILAAAEPMASIFRHVCSHPGLATEVIGGSADDATPAALAGPAQAVLDGLNAAELERLRDLYATRFNQGRATTDLAQAARAAAFGAIDTLLVDMDAAVAGTVDEEDGRLTPGEGDGSVTDEITRHALRGGARVVAVRRGDMPGGQEVAAILRYAM